MPGRVRAGVLWKGLHSGFLTQHTQKLIPPVCSRTHLQGPRCFSEMAAHRLAEQGFTNGKEYEKWRPSYTEDLVRHVVRSLYQRPGNGAQYDVLELGAGTGKFTRMIVPLLDKGARYLASEPMEDFLRTLRRQTADVETQCFPASRIPLPDNSVQNIVCAQSLHWFADDQSLTEIARVLVPSGKLVAVWNRKDWDQALLKSVRQVLHETMGPDDQPINSQEWKHALETFPGLKFVEESFLPGVTDMKGSKDFVLRVFSTTSAIAAVDETNKGVALSKLRAVLDEYFPGDQEIQIPFQSVFYCVEKV